MSEKQLISIIEDLKNSVLTLSNSVDYLKESISKLTGIQTDIFNDNPHDMMRELNGSLQELIRTLESKS